MKGADKTMQINLSETTSTLIRKTKNHEMRWSSTSAEDQFLLNLSSGAILLTRYQDADITIELSFLDSNGKKVDSLTASDDDKSNKENFSLLLRLFDSVRNEKGKATNTIKGILDEINKDGLIGN